MTIDREKLLKMIEEADNAHIPYFTGGWSELDALIHTAKEQDRISHKLTKMLAAILIELQDLNERLKGEKQ